ncbi:phosphotransferase enzyme family protein [Paenibacillus sp. HJGM_3]|uniref:phosphotransferase enzyme family protein n=1 Tax=Paenibacillus sp. HJGM_3 TaxID=3379816 RepID=UPI0038598061
MEVLQAYGLSDSVSSCIPGGTANRNFIIQGGGEERVLRRRNSKYSGEAQLRYEAEYLRHMAAHGIPVPAPLHNRMGQLWTVSNDGGVYQLYPFLGGQPFDRERIEQVEDAGRFLAALHDAGESFVPLASRTFPRYDRPADMMEAVESVRSDRHSVLLPEEKRIFDFLIARLQSLQAQLSDTVYWALPAAVIHGDYHPANVKYAGNRVCGLFDFDWVGVQPRIRDVADGLIYFSGVRDDLLDGGDIFSLTRACTFAPERCRAFLQAYQSEASRRLDDRELACLPWQMTARLINSRVLALPKIPSVRYVEMLTEGMESPLIWLAEHQESFFVT